MPLISRRDMVRFSAALGASAPFTATGEPAKKLKIIVAGGHPGDPEYGCGGTIAKFTGEGHDVTLLYLNRGEKGCAQKTALDCASTRVSEAQQACRILNAAPRFASQIDGEAIVDARHYD